MTTPEYPVDLSAVDITPYRSGNTGVDYLTTFDSGVSGPHVMINAVTHGNELCGAITVDYLFRHDIRPVKGKLTLGFANYEAYLSFDLDNPDASRFVEEDFNRVWGDDVLNGDRNTVETRRARKMRPIIDSVDLLFDIHSMQHKTPPLMMAGGLAKGRKLAKGVGLPKHVVSDFGHAAGTRLRDYGGFGDATSEKNALLVECGQHWESKSANVAIQSTFRFLQHLNVIDSHVAAEDIDDQNLPPQTFVEVTDPVTINSDDFKFTQDFKGLEVIKKKETIIAYDGDQPVTTPYDDCTLIMPSRRLQRGNTAVRLGRYVDTR